MAWLQDCRIFFTGTPPVVIFVLKEAAVILHTKALFRSKTFHPKLSHRILRYIHGILNIDKIKKLIAQFACKLREERFEPN
jgi:hypothetical protein